VAGPSLLVSFLADTKGLQKGIQDADNQAGGFKANLVKVGAAIGAAFAATKIVEFAKDSIKAAQDLNANMSRTSTIFGAASDDVVKWSENSAKSLRISQAEALGAANALGKTLVGSFGLSGEAAATMSTGVVELARDMAAFNRVPFEEALDKVTAGLNGQTRGLKTLGVVLDASEIKQKALTMGLGDAAGNVDAAGRAQATYALMLEKTTLQQGATERGANSLKGQQERLSAEWKDAQATIGNALLPVVTELATIFTDKVVPIIQIASKVFSDYSGIIIPLAGILLGVVGAIKVWTAVQTVLNVVLTANPIGLIVVGIGLLVAGIVLLATKTQFFQKTWQVMTDGAKKGLDLIVGAAKFVFDWIVKNWPYLLAVLGGPFGAAVAIIISHFDKIKAGIDAVVDWFAKLPGRIVAGLSAAASAIYNFFADLARRILAPLEGVDLFGAGKRIIESLGRGITAAGDALLAKVKGIADKITGLWPFSPAKWGPFRDHPPEKAGARLVELWGQGMASQERDLERTAARLAGAASIDATATYGAAGAGMGTGGAATATERNGPAVVIQNAIFQDEADIDLFLRRVGWAAQTATV
jgi:hypothetical protein